MRSRETNGVQDPEARPLRFTPSDPLGQLGRLRKVVTPPFPHDRTGYHPRNPIRAAGT